MSDERPHDPPPDFESLEPAFSDPSTEERVYSVLVQRTQPMSVSEVVEAVGCSKDTARKYLDWFTVLGIAVKHDGRPARYERNQEYFDWRYVSRLADSHSIEELKANVIELRDRLETYRQRYDADDPSSVSIHEAAAAHEAAIEDVWDELSTWAGLRDELRLHDRARQRLADRHLTGEASAD